MVRSLEHLSCDDWLRELVVQPGEGTGPGPHKSLPVLKGRLQKSWRGTFYRGMERQG